MVAFLSYKKDVFLSEVRGKSLNTKASQMINLLLIFYDDNIVLLICPDVVKLSDNSHRTIFGTMSIRYSYAFLYNLNG